MSLTAAVLKFAAPLPDIEAYSRFMFIGPHPDDIEIGAGATAAKLAGVGKSVCFVICTDGRYGDTYIKDKCDHADIAKLRQDEARQAAALLGVRDVRFLELSDGGFYSYEELVKRLAVQIGDFSPDVIFAPDPDTHSECHVDHLNAGTAARRMAYLAPYPGIMQEYQAKAAEVKALAYYMTARPNCFIKTKSSFDKQLKAIFSCHLSQFPVGSQDTKSVQMYLRLRSTDMGLRCFSSNAEGFRVLGQVHMHCMPEAGL